MSAAAERLYRRHEPGYMDLFRSGELSRRARLLDESLESCVLCPRRCGVNRKVGKLGACRVGVEPRVAAVSIPPWEEPPLSGRRGSGTIFFSGCTLQCLFCQNFPISQLGVGRLLTVEELAEGMLRLQRKGAHNINLVTATHQMPAFLKALELAVPLGLRLPIVYNTSGYERVETLRLLEDLVDVYLPDIKYDAPLIAERLSGRADYVESNRAALREMWRQTGPLVCNDEGLAVRGMIVRHMVLPEDLSGTARCMAFLAREMGPGVWVSLMNQYFPAHKAHHTPPLDRKVTPEEYEAAFQALHQAGLENGFVQEECGESFCG